VLTGYNNSAGISIVTFMIAVVVSMYYYQFVYVPEANGRPILPKAVLEPRESVQVIIVEGAWQESSQRNYVPKNVRGILGVSNKVVWTNADTIGHTVTTRDEYTDSTSSRFDSNEQLGALIMPGETFEFTFTKVGEFTYACVPHPYMKCSVEIVEDFS
jgi:plastocyanin